VLKVANYNTGNHNPEMNHLLARPSTEVEIVDIKSR